MAVLYDYGAILSAINLSGKGNHHDYILRPLAYVHGGFVATKPHGVKC